MKLFSTIDGGTVTIMSAVDIRDFADLVEEKGSAREGFASFGETVEENKGAIGEKMVGLNATSDEITALLLAARR